MVVGKMKTRKVKGYNQGKYSPSYPACYGGDKIELRGSYFHDVYSSNWRVIEVKKNNRVILRLDNKEDMFELIELLAKATDELN